MVDASDRRYGRVEDVLDLALHLCGTMQGLTLDDIAARYGVGTRTARRMLSAIERVVGDDHLVHHRGADDRKYWEIESPLFAPLFQVDSDELAALEAGAELAEREADRPLAKVLRELGTKIRALMSRDGRRRIDPDLEGLMEIQGVAYRPGPRPGVDEALLQSLRMAALMQRRVRIRHCKPEARRAAWQKVDPLGILYGSRHYLVAVGARRREPVLFRLSRIERVEPTDESFAPPEGFSMEGYARRSFGVFQEPPIDVVWRFGAAVADEASEYRFHPDQRTQRLDDGSLLVRFRAGGILEMSWHLFQWGEDVEVLSPPELREAMQAQLTASLRAHRRRVTRVDRSRWPSDAETEMGSS